MPHDAGHDAGVGQQVAEQDQGSDRRYSVCLAVMATSFLTDGQAPEAPNHAKAFSLKAWK
jgi:hypothetical protein